MSGLGACVIAEAGVALLVLTKGVDIVVGAAIAVAVDGVVVCDGDGLVLAWAV